MTTEQAETIELPEATEPTPIQAAVAVIRASDLYHTEPVMAATAYALMIGYHVRWKDSGWRAVPGEVERTYQLPIVNPDTGMPSRTFVHAGKKDAIAEHEGKNYLVEHKTAGEEIEDPNAPYWRRLDIDAQVSGYVLASWQDGLKLDGTLYDVIRKPGIRPKQITKADRAEIVSRGVYCGQKVREDARLAVSTDLTTEDAYLYALRLIDDCTTRPQWYFQRKTIPRMDSQILDYARELWQTADEVRLARLYRRWYRNSSACMLWGRPCDFLGICSGHDHPGSDRWVKKDNVHRELDALDGDSRAALTQTSLATFKTCKRKYYLRYELGIERLNKEESDSLVFGKLFHDALAAYWAALT